MSGGRWDKYGLSLAQSMTYIDFYDAILRKLFKGFYPGFWSKIVPDKFETFKLFMRHYAFDVKKYTIEDLYNVNIMDFYNDSRLTGTCIYYFQSKYILFFLKAFPELSVLRLRQVPKDFWRDEINVIYAIRHLIEIEYAFTYQEICDKFTARFLADVGYDSLLRLGYSTFDLLQLCYPSKFKAAELSFGKSYGNVDTATIECIKLLLVYADTINIDLGSCKIQPLSHAFGRLYNKFLNLSHVYHITFNELKEYAIQYREEHTVDESILNLLTVEEIHDIKRKYTEYANK